jgi:DDE superfamily endonuclease
MLSLPIAFRSAMGVFAPVFSRPVWQHVKVLMTGAVLAPGKRTVTAILQMMGRSTAPNFQTYHRVLNRAVWSPLKARRLLLRLLVAVFIPRGVVVCGLDDTIERRRGEQITAKGISRDPGRSSHTYGVTASGLRGLACMLLTPRAWAGRVWALPFLTALCPSERFSAQRGRRHQPLTARAWQMMRLVVRWWPGREIIVVADSRCAALERLDKVATLPRASVITRRRLDAALSDPPPPRKPRTPGRPRLTGKRRPTREAGLADEKTPWTRVLVAQWYGEGPREVEVATDTAGWYHTGKPPVALRWGLIRAPHARFQPQALLSTNLEHTPAQMLPWFVRRWTRAVTFAEARTHLGLETQRPWHDRAMARTIPALLSLYAIITLNAQLLIAKGMTCVRSTAWYRKTRPTFADAIALVRRQLWDHLSFATSLQETDMIKIPRELFERFIDAICYAA